MDATSALAVQHRAIEQLFDNLAHETRRRGRTAGVSRLAEELVAHLIAEEDVFYPAVRRALGKGHGGASGAGNQHLALRIGLRKLLETNVGDASFVEHIDALKGSFAQHVHDDEAELFPRVVSEVSEAHREVLGAEILSSRPPVWIVTTERRAPSRSDDDWARGGRVCLPARAR